MPADDLASRVTLDAFGARIPVYNAAVHIKHVDCIIGHALDEVLESPLCIFQLGQADREFLRTLFRAALEA